jgi:transcription elongation GreA/GreB family factor
MVYIKDRKPVENLDRVIRFTVDGEELVRKLVITSHDIANEISVASPVGTRLACAEAGNQYTIPLPPSGDVFLVVNVLEVGPLPA